MRNQEQLLSSNYMPVFMVEFARSQGSWSVVPFHSSLCREEFILNKDIPVSLLQKWCPHLGLYSTKQKNLWIPLSVRCWFIRQIFICFIALYAGYYARYSHSLSLRNSKLLSFQGSTSYSIYAAFALVNVPTRRRSWEKLMSGGPDLYPKRT